LTIWATFSHEFCMKKSVFQEKIVKKFGVKKFNVKTHFSRLPFLFNKKFGQNICVNQKCDLSTESCVKSLNKFQNKFLLKSIVETIWQAE